jgi:hypothetical protein
MIYLRNLQGSMGPNQADYTPVLEDKMASIELVYLALDHALGERESAKHMDAHKHFAFKAVQNGHMRLYTIPTQCQLASQSAHKGTTAQPI